MKFLTIEQKVSIGYLFIRSTAPVTFYPRKMQQRKLFIAAKIVI